MVDIDKLINLAFHSSATEGEAINAFLALRRQPNIIEHISNAKKVDKFTNTWNAIVPSTCFDMFLRSVSAYKKEPYFIISETKKRNNIIDAWNISITVYLNSHEEIAEFSKWFVYLFDRMKRL